MESMGDETKVVVARMLARRRRLRLPIVLGGALSVGFVAYMAVQFGQDHRHELQVEGPVDPEHAFVAPAPAPAEVADSFVPPTPPGAAPPPTSAAVSVVMPARARLSLDGQPVPGGPEASLTLSPGHHVLMVRDGGRTLVQRLQVAAGERFAVRFGARIEVTKR